MDNLHMN